MREGFNYSRRNPTEQALSPKEVPLSGMEEKTRETYEENMRMANNGKVRLIETEFSNSYTPLEIKQDVLETKEYASKHKEHHERAEMLATIIAHEGSRHGSAFFGDTCEITPTATYDDVFNGTDLIMESKDANGNVVRLGIDVTTASHDDQLERKLFREARNLREGRMTTIKYFRSKINPNVTGATEMPTVVIGVSSQYLMEHVQDFYDATKTSRGLIAHELGSMLRNEVLSQLKGQIFFLESMKPRSTKQEVILGTLRNTLLSLSDIFAKKEKSANTTISSRFDSTYVRLARRQG